MTRYLSDEEMEIVLEERFFKERDARLARNPDCRDPDHPGCPKCDPDLWEPEND